LPEALEREIAAEAAAAPAKAPAAPAKAPAAPAKAPAAPAKAATPAPNKGLMSKVTGEPEADAAGAEKGAPPPAAAFEAPKGLPDNLKGKDATETLAKVWEWGQAQRNAVAKRGAPPETPDAYEFKLPEALKDKIDLSGEGDKAGLEMFQAVAHEAGLSQAQFQTILEKVMVQAESKGFTKDMAPVDWEAKLHDEYEMLGGERRALQRANAVKAWGNQLVVNGIFTKDEFADFELMAGTGLGVKVMEKLRQLTGGGNIPTDAAPSGARSKADLDAMMRDPRWAKRDPAYMAEVEKAFRESAG
jgi:hypothetical protein